MERVVENLSTLYLIKQQAISFSFLMMCFYYSRMIINLFPFPLFFQVNGNWVTQSNHAEVVDLIRGNAGCADTIIIAWGRLYNEIG